MKIRACVSAAALVALAGTAMAQPVLDGLKDAGLYQNSPIWQQNQPTSFGDNQAPPPCQEDASGGELVTTGVEYRIPLSSLGNISGAIKVSAFINGGGHDFISNQISGGIGDGMGVQSILAPSIGDPRGTDFNSIDLIQHVDTSAGGTGTPIIDGSLDAAIYGAPLFVQGSVSSFGDGDDPAINTNNGDEIDAIYASNDGTYLYLFIAGNVNAAFNKLDVFIDVDGARGQNQLRGDNPDVDFNGLNRMGNSDQAGVDAMTSSPDGLIFDSGFTADYYIQYTHGNTSEVFASIAPIVDDPSTLTVDVDFGFLGGGGGALPGGQPFIDGDLGGLGGGGVGTGFQIALDNSNVAGVGGICPPPPSTDIANGSELNAVYTHYDSGANELYVFLAGNIETNANLFVLFLDVGNTVDQVPFFGPVDPGQNQLILDNVDFDFGALQRMGPGDLLVDDDNDPETPDVTVAAPGLRFDSDFSADQMISFKIFDPTNVQWFANGGVMREFGPLLTFQGGILDYGTFFGGVRATTPIIDFSGPQLDAQPGSEANIFSNFAPRTATVNNLLEVPAIPVPGGLIRIGLDNSNQGGVDGTNVNDPSSVNTGAEFVFNLDELGWDGSSEIKLTAFIASDGYGFVSNQITGGLPTADQLGEPRLIDLESIAGNQYVVLDLFEGGPVEPACIPDVTTTNTNPGDAGFGVADGTVDGADLSYFVEQWLGTNAAVADVTTTNTNPGDAGYGEADGSVDGADLSFFVEQWLAGCP